MSIRKIITAGIIAGLIMGVALFITGAIAAFVVYGPQFTPSDKFEPEQVNAWFFFWTKLVIGCFFGIFFSFIYSKSYLLPIKKGALKGLSFGFLLWLIISLWSISHPLVYGSDDMADKLFWIVYTFGGFTTCGLALGLLYKKFEKENNN